jgi:amino acid transporter
VLVLTAAPMLVIANAYRRCNLWNANCGASFEWVGRAINPYLGFLTGWLMIVGYVISAVAGVEVIRPAVLAAVLHHWPGTVHVSAGWFSLSGVGGHGSLAAAPVLGVLPLGAAGFLAWIIGKSIQAAPAAQNWSLVGIVLAGMGVMLVARFGLRSGFFAIPRESEKARH